MGELVERAYEIYVERIGRRPAPMDDDYAERVRRGCAFVADESGLLGLVVLIPKQDHVLVENVAVDPGRQGEGIGRELLAFAESYAIKMGVDELRLYTNAAMTENVALYPHLGYLEVARRSDRGFERVFFLKKIDPS